MSTPTACLAGEWTIHNIAQQREALLSLIAEGHHAFDAGAVTEMDTAGLQLLLSAQRTLARQGLELSFTHPSGTVKDVLKAYGLDTNLQPAYGSEGAP